MDKWQTHKCLVLRSISAFEVVVRVFIFHRISSDPSWRELSGTTACSFSWSCITWVWHYVHVNIKKVFHTLRCIWKIILMPVAYYDACYFITFRPEWKTSLASLINRTCKRYDWFEYCVMFNHMKHSSRYALRWRHNGRDSVPSHQPHDCLLNRLFRRRSKKASKLRVTGLCAGNSPGTGEFPAQMASNAESVCTWWRHHGPITLYDVGVW